MINTYFLREFYGTPKLFTKNLKIQEIRNYGQVTIKKEDVASVLIDEGFIKEYNPECFKIEAYKTFNLARLYVDTGTGKYKKMPIYSKNNIDITVKIGNKDIPGVSYFLTTKQAFNELNSHMDLLLKKELISKPLISFSRTNIDLTEVASHIQIDKIIGVGISVPNDSRIRYMRVSGDMDVLNSIEVKNALKKGGEINYIKFIHDFRGTSFHVKIGSDLSFSFYSDQGTVHDIKLMESICTSFCI